MTDNNNGNTNANNDTTNAAPDTCPICKNHGMYLDDQWTEQFCGCLVGASIYRKYMDGYAEAHGFRKPKLFFNLSNHPLSSWSHEQLDAAQELGLGQLELINYKMPMVDPSASAEEAMSLARDIAAKVVGAGGRGAFVAGEFSLTVALVAALRACGVRCFTATTSREVVETTAPDGAVVKISVFRFVRWREYI